MQDEDNAEKPAVPHEVETGGVDGIDTFKVMVRNRPPGVEDIVNTATTVQLERTSPDQPFEVITPAPEFKPGTEATTGIPENEDLQLDWERAYQSEIDNLMVKIAKLESDVIPHPDPDKKGQTHQFGHTTEIEVARKKIAILQEKLGEIRQLKIENQQGARPDEASVSEMGGAKPRAETNPEDLEAADDFLKSVEQRKGSAEDWQKMAEEAQAEILRLEAGFKYKTVGGKDAGEENHRKDIAFLGARIEKYTKRAEEIRQAQAPYQEARQGGIEPEAVAARAKLLGKTAVEEFAKLPNQVQEAVRVRDKYKPGTSEWEQANQILAGMVKEGQIGGASAEGGKGRGTRSYQTEDSLQRYERASQLSRKLGGEVEGKVETGEIPVEGKAGEEAPGEGKAEEEAKFQVIYDKFARGEMTTDEYIEAYAKHKGVKVEEVQAEVIAQMKELASQADKIDAEATKMAIEGRELSPEEMKKLLGAHPEFREFVEEAETAVVPTEETEEEEVVVPGETETGRQTEVVDMAAVERKAKWVYAEVKRLARGKMDRKREDKITKEIAEQRLDKKKLSADELAEERNYLQGKDFDIATYNQSLKRHGFWENTLGKLALRRIEDYDPLIDWVASGPKEKALIHQKVKEKIKNEGFWKALGITELETIVGALKGLKDTMLKMIYEALQQEIQQQGG